MSSSPDKSLESRNFTISMRLRLLARYLKTNFVITFMLFIELFRGIFKLFIPTAKKCINNKVALITGGGHGIGKALAFRMAEKGCHIAIADINISDAQETVNEIIKRYKVKAVCFKVDVSKYNEVKELKKNVENSLGFVDLLVNNVGLLALDLSLREQTPERVQHVVNVNLMSHFWTTRLFLDGMIERKYGHIIASGSFAGKITLPCSITYSTTKYAVTGFMSALFDELCVLGVDEYVKTTTIYPLFVDTSDDLAELVGDKIPLWSADRIAEKYLNGILKNERNIFVPKFAKFSTLLNMLPDRIIKYAKVSNFQGNHKLLSLRNTSVEAV